MKKLWLTYAWADNQKSDVGFVAQELRSPNLDARMDRWSLAAGQRLWEQIGDGISSPLGCDAWAIYATETSLRSKPCREELAIALDRALRARGDTFPIIGIFPKAVAHDLISPAICIRLYVSLADADWKARIAGAIEGKAPVPPNDIIPFHEDGIRQ